ncbi:hypothetical protein ACOJBO_03895 [Rhizobium beringeri]
MYRHQPFSIYARTTFEKDNRNPPSFSRLALQYNLCMLGDSQPMTDASMNPGAWRLTRPLFCTIACSMNALSLAA